MKMISFPISSIVIIAITCGGVAVLGKNGTDIQYTVNIEPGAILNISLSKSVTWANREVFSESMTINGTSFIELNFYGANPDISFIIIQVHSHIYDVMIMDATNKAFESGKDIGMYSSVNPINSFFIINYNVNIDANLMLQIHGYKNEDPIPGGCNLVFPVQISPVMRNKVTKDIVRVDAAPSMLYGDKLCLQGENLDHTFYIMYIYDWDNEAESYFEAIKKMSTLENIRENGVIIPHTTWPMRRTLSAYPGTAAVFVAVATSKVNKNYYSVYIPTFTSACLGSKKDNCEAMEGFVKRVLCASLIFLGVFICFFGHRFFVIELFVIGILAGAIISYVSTCILANPFPGEYISAYVLIGVLFGGLWVVFWMLYGIPVIAVSLPTLNLGFLIASIIYNKFPGELSLLEDDLDFWLVFVLIMLLVTVCLVSVAFYANLLCCAVLGAYAVVVPIDYYIGSHLKYIVINTLRRAVVPKFHQAVLMLPFGSKDALMVFLWVVLASSGLVFQYYYNHGRPPFPPPPSCFRPGRPERAGYEPLPSTRNSPDVESVPVAIETTDERTSLLAR